MATNNFEARLDRLHARARRSSLLRRFTEFTRMMLGVGFFAPGLTKALGNRFTMLGVDTPVGFFFEAMYRTGGYWRFIGLSQIAASILVLIPRTATLGAALFFPIILNIFIITVSMEFAGTPVVTGLMLLAVTYLLCWDYHKFKPLLFESSTSHPVGEAHLHWLERTGYTMAAAGGMGMLVMARFLPSQTALIGGLTLGLFGGAMALVGWGLAARPVAAGVTNIGKKMS
jgi:hypothetical protein